MPNKSYLSEAELRRRAREYLETRQLPNSTESCTWGGKGCGDPCDLCADPIQPSEVEYEVTDPRDPGNELRFHIACHDAWRAESASGASAYSGPSASLPASVNDPHLKRAPMFSFCPGKSPSQE